MIGKTRQSDAAEIEELFDSEAGRARGMVRRKMPAGTMRHARRRPAADLATWITHYWIINWDLRVCEPYIAESVPHPNIHLIFEDGRAVVAGVQTHKFSRRLEGEGRVFGVKFRPGGFRPFYEPMVSMLANRIIPARRIFGADIKLFEEIALSDCGEKEKVQAANAFFHERMPEPDRCVALAGKLVDLILLESTVKTVHDLARRADMSARSLQRLFGEYVGASPKWVIRRYRLHELIERFNSGAKIEWSQLALDLGYFDQTHLINDFRSMVGFPPSEYQKLISRTSE